MRTRVNVTQRDCEAVLRLVAEWMGKRGYAEHFYCPEGRALDHNGIAHADGTLCPTAIAGPAPTGHDAAYQGLGPELIMDWKFLSMRGAPTVVLEGGPEEWAIACSFWVQEQLDAKGLDHVFVEPATSWALAIFPKY